MNSVSSRLNPAKTTSSPMPNWGMAAEDLYRRYHELNDLATIIPLTTATESCLQTINHLQQVVMETLVELVEDVSEEPTTYSTEKQATAQLVRHTTVLKAVVENVDRELEQIYKQFPSLKVQEN